jgi:hypothetical protein
VPHDNRCCISRERRETRTSHQGPLARIGRRLGVALCTAVTKYEPKLQPTLNHTPLMLSPTHSSNEAWYVRPGAHSNLRATWRPTQLLAFGQPSVRMGGFFKVPFLLFLGRASNGLTGGNKEVTMLVSHRHLTGTSGCELAQPPIRSFLFYFEKIKVILLAFFRLC